ncbi:MAG TPA: LysE family translocator [Pseudolabrys sp.]|jgi:homoserine/homoserine lactone efflux protein|nr:LysE family translocator [Pseudolabrys sp.]
MNDHLFSAFLLITFVLVIVPGPIVTLVIATGATRGTRAALITVIGTTLGNAALLACIALGLNWILRTSAEVFEVLRWAGAAYLIWLGIQSWRAAGRVAEAPPPRHRVHISRGFLVAITNPKTIAFFTAFLPQFVDPALPAGWQLFVMCAVTVVLAGLTDAAWAVAAGLGRAWLMKPRHNALLGRLSGVVLIGGGLWLSLGRKAG